MDGSIDFLKIDVTGRLPLSERVCEGLKGVIVNCHLSSEAKSLESDVAQKMGVSPRRSARRFAAWLWSGVG